MYRIGYFIPLPMIDQAALAVKMRLQGSGTLGGVLNFVSLFSGGNLSTSCIFSLGIMPYISASIIMQLLSSGVVPALEKLKKEGRAGRRRSRLDAGVDGAHLHHPGHLHLPQLRRRRRGRRRGNDDSRAVSSGAFTAFYSASGR